MKISEIADIATGTILTRVKPASKYDDTEKVPSISMQELSYFSSGKIDEIPERSMMTVLSSKKDQCAYAKANDVLYGLTQFRSMIIQGDFVGRLIPSNFAIIRIKSKDIDPSYLMWSLNEGPCSKKTISKMIQGTASVKNVSVTVLKNLDLTPLPPLARQRSIGKLYQMSLRREKIDGTIRKVRNALMINALNQINNKEN
ncbi:MAG: hypothetical protein LKG11_06790 [Bacilli bacterium]|jgi:hypothetical protein|nr:hypothetical protein [Bacilli bacterium]